MSSSNDGLMIAWVGDGTQVELVVVVVAAAMLVVSGASGTTVEVIAAMTLDFTLSAGVTEEETCWMIDVAAAAMLDLTVSIGAAIEADTA